MYHMPSHYFQIPQIIMKKCGLICIISTKRSISIEYLHINNQEITKVHAIKKKEIFNSYISFPKLSKWLALHIPSYQLECPTGIEYYISCYPIKASETS